MECIKYKIVNNALLFVNYNEEIARTNLMAWKGCARTSNLFIKLRYSYHKPVGFYRMCNVEPTWICVIPFLSSKRRRRKAGPKTDLGHIWCTGRWTVIFQWVNWNWNGQDPKMNEHFTSDTSGANHYHRAVGLLMHIEYFVSSSWGHCDMPQLAWD